MDLTDFGFVDETPEPLVYRKAIVLSPPKTGNKIAGFIGHERRRDMVVYTTLRGKSHFYESGNGYAISDCILDLLDDHRIARIFIHETEADVRSGDQDEAIRHGDVLEFTLRDYQVDGEPVPEEYLSAEWDTQTWLDVDRARHVWPDLGTDLYRSPFERACRRCNAELDPTPPEVTR